MAKKLAKELQKPVSILKKCLDNDTSKSVYKRERLTITGEHSERGCRYITGK